MASTKIHPTALVEDGARLGVGCVVHPYALISRHCELGDSVVVHPFAVLGGDPQDLSFSANTSSGVRIGARTVIREHVTVSRATKAQACTVVGSDCLLMTACHVAHDCHVGDRVVIANAVLLAGHVQVGNGAFLGGGALVHQFCRIGEGAMIGGAARISRDIAPFSLATGRNAVIGLNTVGLRRRGVQRDVVDEIRRAFRALRAPVGNLREIAANTLQQGSFSSAEARTFLEFFEGGRRGFARPGPRSAADETDDS